MKKIIIKISGITTTMSLEIIKRELKSLKNIKEVEIDIKGKAVIYYEKKIHYSRIKFTIKKLGYKIIEREYEKILYRTDFKYKFIIITFLAVINFLLRLNYIYNVLNFIVNPDILVLIMFLNATIAILLTFKYYKNGVNYLLNLKVNRNSLLFISIALNYFFSIYYTIKVFFLNEVNFDINILNNIHYDSLIVILAFYIGAKFFEDLSIKKTVGRYKKFHDLFPDTVLKKNDENFYTIDINEIKEDDVILIKKNEIIPIDGIILFGETTIDETNLLNDKLMIKKEGSLVYASSINIDNDIEVKVLNTKENTNFYNIIKQIENSYSKEYFNEELIHKILKNYFLLILSISTFSLIIWMFSTGDFSRSLKAFLVIMMYIFPASLVSSTSLSFIKAKISSKKRKIEFTNDYSISNLKSLNTFIIYDTSIFVEKYKIKNIIYNYKFNENIILKYYKSILINQSHYLKEAIDNYYDGELIDLDVSSVEFGYKVNNEEVWLGNKKLLNKINLSHYELYSDDLDGHILYLIIDNELVSAIIFEEDLRENCDDLFEYLNYENIYTILITEHDEKTLGNLIPKLKFNSIFYDKDYNFLESTIKKIKTKEMIGLISDKPFLYSSADIEFFITNTYSDLLFSDIIIYNNNISNIINSFLISDTVLSNIRRNVKLSFFMNSFMIILATGIFEVFNIKLIPLLSILIIVVMNLIILFVVLFSNKYKYYDVNS